MKSMTLHPGALEYLQKFKMFNGGFDTKIMSGIPLPEGVPAKARIVVRPMAYLKMVKLIMEFSTEVGWHGLVHRDSEDPSTYIIEDVMVYPQNVTGTTITTDETRMTNWLDTFPDEQFKQIRFHGHSHVNMGVFSSGTDDDLQRDLIGMMKNPEDFYLFFIMNKRLEIFIRLYDNKFGVMYESSDCDVYITDGTNDIVKFIQDSKAQVKAVTYSYTGNQYGKGGNYQGNKPSNPAQNTKQPLPPANQGKSTQSVQEDDYGYDDYPLGYFDGYDWVECRGGYYQ